MINKCTIIGLGQIGMGYDLTLDSKKFVYTHARAFSTHPKFELLSAVDPKKAQRDLFMQYYDKPAYTSIATALQTQMPDVIVIASPTEYHSLTLKEVLRYSSPKAILCEKPLSYNLSEARNMVEDCKKAGVDLFVNYIRRADYGAIEIKRRIEFGEIVSPIKGVVWYSKGFLHNGSHFFNLLEFWLGAFVNAKILNHGRLLNYKDSEPDVQVEFERGKVIFISAWEEAFSHYTIELLSKSGRLRYDKGGELITWQLSHEDPNINGYKILKDIPETISNDMSRYQWHITDQLHNAISAKPHTLSTGNQSLTTLEAMNKIINERQL